MSFIIWKNTVFREGTSLQPAVYIESTMKHILLVFLVTFRCSRGSGSDDDILPYPALRRRNYESALLWPEGKVYYVLEDGEFSRFQKAGVVRVLKRLESVTCVRFIPRTDQAGYVRFRNIRHRCASPIGYRPGKSVDLFIGWPECQKKGNIQHEVLHILGMWHEHTRQDRDNYVTVLWNNIAKGKANNFKLSPKDITSSLPYDYNSVLHYRAMAFSKYGSDFTLLPRDISMIAVMGQRNGATIVDVAKLNKMYDCPQPYYSGAGLENISYIKKIIHINLVNNVMKRNNTEKNFQGFVSSYQEK